MPATPGEDTALDVPAAGERDTTASEESADAGVGAVVPVPAPKPDRPAVTTAPEADTAPQQTAALPAPEAESDEATGAALSDSGGEQGTEPAAEYRIWLVSADNAVAAEDLREETLARHGDNLGGVELDIYEMDYGERGHFYRILAGPLYSADAANDLCRRLREDDLQGFCKILTR